MARRLTRKIHKPPSKCIFCGGRDLSKEHVWADWLRHHIPRTFKRTNHVTNHYINNPRTGLVETRFGRGRLHRPGDPHSQRLRVVCKSCNNQWMSELQEDAKDILVPLIHGQWPPLETADQSILAAWAVMFTMVVESADPQTMAVSSEERATFRLTRRPADHWRVWVAPYRGETWRGKFWHTGMGLYDRPLPPGVALPSNTQITTFAVGGLLFHTFSTTAGVTIELTGAYDLGLGLKAIWPTKDSPVASPIRTLGDDDADRVATTLRGIMTESFV